MTAPSSDNPLRHLRLSDIRGMAQLASEATSGVTDITEGVHRSVWDALGLPGGRTPGRTRGITGLVYRIVQGVTQLVGQGSERALRELERLFDSEDGSRPGTPLREALLAALNGVMGDRLAAMGSPFAIPMALRYLGGPLSWHDAAPMPGATGKVLLLVHGLCMSDLQTHAQHNGHEAEHGRALAAVLGYTPVYLRYNSGLHISQNGRELAAQLQQLVAHWPVPVRELTVVAHSMGGLLIRSAVHYAREGAMRWPDHLGSIVFLGTPQHGAPLERAGNWVDVILGSTPHGAPFARLGQLRSAGITDLRHGLVLDEDWHGHDRFRRRPDSRRVVPLPEGVACYAIAATTASRRSVLANRLMGDGLVPLRSALGEHDDPHRDLAFSKESQWIGYRMNHMQLLNSPAVARQMLQWLSPPPRVSA